MKILIRASDVTEAAKRVVVLHCKLADNKEWYVGDNPSAELRMALNGIRTYYDLETVFEHINVKLKEMRNCPGEWGGHIATLYEILVNRKCQHVDGRVFDLPADDAEPSIDWEAVFSAEDETANKYS